MLPGTHTMFLVFPVQAWHLIFKMTLNSAFHEKVYGLSLLNYCRVYLYIMR
jgi:hypothetical protein